MEGDNNVVERENVALRVESTKMDIVFNVYGRKTTVFIEIQPTTFNFHGSL